MNDLGALDKLMYRNTARSEILCASSSCQPRALPENVHQASLVCSACWVQLPALHLFEPVYQGQSGRLYPCIWKSDVTS